MNEDGNVVMMSIVGCLLVFCVFLLGYGCHAMHTEEAIRQKAEIYYLQDKVKKMEEERK